MLEGKVGRKFVGFGEFICTYVLIDYAALTPLGVPEGPASLIGFTVGIAAVSATAGSGFGRPGLAQSLAYVQKKRRALKRARARFPEMSVEVLDAQNSLGVAYEWSRRLDESVALHSETLEKCEEVFGKADERTLTVKLNLITAMALQERLEEALHLNLELCLETALWPYCNRLRLAAMHNLGSCLIAEGRREDALNFLESTYLARSDCCDRWSYDLRVTTKCLSFAGKFLYKPAYTVHEVYLYGGGWQSIPIFPQYETDYNSGNEYRNRGDRK